MGEFTEYGFYVRAEELHPVSSVVVSSWPPKLLDVTNVVDKLLDAFIAAIEARDLRCGGGTRFERGSERSHAVLDIFVTRPRERGKKLVPVTEEDRAAMKAWLDEWKFDGFALKKTEVGPLVDAWA